MKLDIKQNAALPYIGYGSKWIERHDDRFVLFIDGQSVDACKDAPVGIVWDNGRASYELHVDCWTGPDGTRSTLKWAFEMLTKFQVAESKSVQVR